MDQCMVELDDLLEEVQGQGRTTVQVVNPPPATVCTIAPVTSLVVTRPTWVALVNFLILLWPDKAVELSSLRTLPPGASSIDGVDADLLEAVDSVCQAISPTGVVLEHVIPGAAALRGQDGTYIGQTVPLTQGGHLATTVTMVSDKTIRADPIAQEKVLWGRLDPDASVARALEVVLYTPLQMMRQFRTRLEMDSRRILRPGRAGRHRSGVFLKWLSGT